VKKLILLLLLVPIVSFSQEKEIDFDSVERPPIYPGCEPYVQQLRSCTQRKIQTHINKNLRYPEFAQKTGVQGRVFVQFIIDKDGSIVGIRTRGPHPILEIEAKRIISILPKFIPGYVDGKAVRVPFSMPITFKLQK
jgi:TonB family protein